MALLQQAYADDQNLAIAAINVDARLTSARCWARAWIIEELLRGEMSQREREKRAWRRNCHHYPWL